MFQIFCLCSLHHHGFSLDRSHSQLYFFRLVAYIASHHHGFLLDLSHSQLFFLQTVVLIQPPPPWFLGWMESDLLNRTESISNTTFWPLEHDLLKDAEKFNALERHLLNGAELCLLLEECRKSMWQCSYITLPPFKGLVPIDLRRAMSKPLGCRMEAYRAVTNQAWAAWAGPWHFPCV